MIRGSYLWLDPMIDSTIKSLIVWLIEWSEIPLTKNYLAAPYHCTPRNICCYLVYRAVFKLLSKVITWLWLLRLVIGLKDSRQFFNHWEPKPIAPCTRDFSRASSELRVIARKCDWFIALPAPVVIGQSNCFGFGFSTVIWKPLYHTSE